MAEYSVALGHVLVLGGSAVAVTAIALAVAAARSAMLRRGFSPDSVAVGLSGSLALAPLALWTLGAWATPRIAESFGQTFIGRSMSAAVYDFLLVALLMALAALVFIFLTTVYWITWSRATRAGARRRPGEWGFAVWGLASGLAVIPLLILVWNWR
jgi:hypothetical protein